MKHELKIEPAYLDALLDGSKTFTVRLNDRGYQKGDLLEFGDHNRCEPGHSKPCWKALFEITYVHSGFGLKESFVILAVKQVRKPVDGIAECFEKGFHSCPGFNGRNVEHWPVTE